MKLLFFLVLCSAVLAQGVEFPLPQNTVSDYAEVLGEATKEKVKDIAAELYRAASVNLKVAVIRTLGSVQVENYGRALYDLWGMGHPIVEEDRGVLLLIAIIDRRAKIVAGCALRDILTEDARDRIEWLVMASLGRGEFSEAVLAGTGTILQLIKTYRKGEEGFNWQAALFPPFLLFGIAALLTFVFGGTFIMFFGILMGGLFGYLFFGIIGMILGVGLGFFLNFWTERK